MTALVTKYLPLITDAPGGVQSLRALIFELASVGKLLPSSSSDSCFKELGLVADFVMGQAPPGTECNTSNQGTIFVKTGEFGVLYPVVREWTTKPLKFAKSGDVLICVVGATVGKLNLAIDCAIGRSVAAIRPKLVIGTRYLYYSLMPFTLRLRAQSRGSAQGVIGKSELSCIKIRVPSREEQDQIIAKVDELMALCDRLEADQADAEAAHAQLVEALLGSLTQATDAADFTASWQRLSEHFHTLFTTEASIDALKQTVLQLAVMGKLVPQDPAAESPSVLLDRIAHDIAKATPATSSKKSRTFTEVEPTEQYINLPDSWMWTRLGSQVLSSGAGWSPSCEARQRVDDEWGVLKVSAVSWGEFRPDENKALPANLEARPGHEVQTGDFLVSRANTAELVARSVVVESTPSRLMLSDKIVRLKLTEHCNRRYINLVNSSSFARSYYSAIAGGTSSSMKNVTREQILNLPLPLAPLAEQHRIVAKVEELMALCDQLKAQLVEARQQHAQLATVLVEQAVAA